MELLSDALRYAVANQARFWTATWVHLELSILALLLGTAIFVPLGALAARNDRIGPVAVGLVGSARVVPSLAVLFLLLPVLGTGFVPALAALTILAGPPLIVNTDAGLRRVDPAVVESGAGLGMDAWQLFSRVQLPLALPLLIAGVRTAAVEVIASATLAAFIGAGGLGSFILAGLTLVDYRLLLVGALPVTFLTLGAEAGLNYLERRVTPPS